MPEYIRALLVILFLALIGFFFAKKIVQDDISNSDFNKWKNTWLLVLVVAFLGHDFWIYVLLSSIIILKLTKSASNKMALYFILLFVIPPVERAIPGFGLMNYLFSLSHIRLISLLILLPAALAISHKNKFTFGKTLTDKLLISYAMVILFIQLRDRTVTDALRYVLYSFTDIFLPYYVASRSIKNLPQINTTIYAFITSAIVIAPIAAFEYLKKWLLYNPLPSILHVTFDYGNYLGRGGDLRAIASLSHPIVLGYFFAVALSFYFYISTRINNKLIKAMGWSFIMLGLFAALSRGPWTGAIASLLTFTLLGSNPFKKMRNLLLICLVATPILLDSTLGNKIYNLIPFVGTTDKENVDYRERLFNNSLIVINHSPFFGSDNWRKTPEMIAMTQGEGIIDVVNSYIAIALSKGYVGLFIFVSIFLSVIFSVMKKMIKIKEKNDPLYILGASLISTIVAILITITTTSSINVIPIIYWSVLGLGISYTRIANDYIESKSSNNKANNNMT